jgi:hypothetical protein
VAKVGTDNFVRKFSSSFSSLILLIFPPSASHETSAVISELTVLLQQVVDSNLEDPVVLKALCGANPSEDDHNVKEKAAKYKLYFIGNSVGFLPFSNRFQYELRSLASQKQMKK